MAGSHRPVKAMKRQKPPAMIARLGPAIAHAAAVTTAVAQGQG